MRAQWRAWHRRAHRAVVDHLRAPTSASGDVAGVVAPRMPLLSVLYGRVVAAKRSRALAAAQRISPASVPVLSVGNFTFGATGKTPCVLFLADQILRLTAATSGPASARVPMLLTRGYGDDEWRLFASRFPSCKLAVGADRATLGRQRVAQLGAQLSCVLLEDGLQQWAIRKDLEIVMVDALAPFGNGKLLPLGSLRELPADALARADVVLLHHANLLNDETQRQHLLAAIQRLLPIDRKVVIGTSEMAVAALPVLGDYVAGVYKQDEDGAANDDWGAFRGKTALVVCGVGNPESVARVVAAMGCWTRVQVESFPDHYAFHERDLCNLKAQIAADHEDVVVVTTEKDVARSGELMQRVLGKQLPVHVLVGAFRLNLNREVVLNRVRNLLVTS